MGLSLILSWAFKDAREHIAEPLFNQLFNQFLTEQLFPDGLKRAHVLPLFKNDDPEDPINYQPIPRTGALAKIFEIFIRDQILAYLEKNKLLATTQFAYRKKCQLQMLFYITLKKIRYDLNKKTSLQELFQTYQKLLIRYHILFFCTKLNF